MYDVIVVGGGIAGLINAILTSRSGLKVALFEKKAYPFHRVCGEYLSNEVRPFLIRNNLFPDELMPTNISKFRLSSTNGSTARLPLDLGGFGVSRYAYDHFLYQQAIGAGVEVYQKSNVTDINYLDGVFQVIANHKTFESKIVIGAYGKRAKLDKARRFMQKKSPYIGVKYHVRTDLPADEISLHNFQDGYCGISQVEESKFNLCYLSNRKNLKQHNDIGLMEQRVLHKNPFLADLWKNSDFLLERPIVINEISFDKKELIHNHILMCGDTAGMITPLCGNGMAMAIRSAHLLSTLIKGYFENESVDRTKLERLYTQKWNNLFATRLAVGRQVQHLFGSTWSSNIGVGLARWKPLGTAIISLTHGQPF
ncbi:MAG: NAD(P)/FAD-dependent oxidoreductase [Reichenbachiella sp.]|uniref:NAD(P)/FAD-dependent oxidoreductase n=1 Tax=Reichenbachiella sp. TaxID=2184521 RepID=UPI003264C6E6